MGRRSALAGKLCQLSGDSTPFNFEILAADRTASGAAIYGTVQMEKTESVNQEREVNRFFANEEPIKKAVIEAFCYEPDFTRNYDFALKVTMTATDNAIFVSDRVRSFWCKQTKDSNW